tara:strand:+ start:592 stop:960 length:369 start_codon:yes stop_codon:yes gene_type:complete
MEYETNAIESMLRGVGIKVKLDKRITPIKHPYIKMLIKTFNKHKIKYNYFHETENIIILGSCKDKYLDLNECILSPKFDGITIISFYNTEDELQAQEHLMSIQNIIKDIFPDNLNYEIIGFS